jgi:hypothetical protein
MLVKMTPGLHLKGDISGIDKALLSGEVAHLYGVIA